MKNHVKIGIVSVSTVLSLLLLFGALLGQEKSTKEPYQPLAVLSEVLSKIQTDYVEDPNFNKVTDGALHGLLESLDSYSSYLTPEEYKQYQQQDNRQGSVGIVASKRFGFASIVALLPNGPAERAGLLAGDIIEAIDGGSTREMSLTSVESHLTGPPGSSAKLSIVRERAGEPTPFELKREVIPLPDAAGSILGLGVGYLRVQDLEKGESQKIAARIADLKKQGAQKFVLDLRGDAVGDMDEGVAVANLFLRKGLISYLTGQQYTRQSFLAQPEKAVSDDPLVVVVNSSTAGAAEIVAAAILDNHRGEVVGERTFGIGSIQKVIPLDDGSALLLSIAKYFTPTGKALQDNGIAPTVPVQQAEDETPLPEPGATVAPLAPKPPSEDPFLKRALEVLSAPAAQQKAA